jgi:RNA polymerase II subunit A-like phosphatase
LLLVRGWKTALSEMSTKADKVKVAGEIALPGADYKLYCWKVRNGSAVRAGETVALAIRKDVPVASNGADAPVDLSREDNGAATVASTVDSVQHKRPTRKRRPGANPAVATENLPSKDPEQSSAQTSTKETSNEQEQLPILAKADGIVRMGPRVSKNEGDNGNEIEVIGYIEVCLHATVMDGLCAVCGKAGNSSSSSSSQSNINRNGNSNKNKMSRVTVSGLTVTVSDEEGRRMAEQDAERLRKQHKLSLVLDLDHTLVHATNDVRARHYLNRLDVRTLVLPMLEEPSPQQQNLFMQHFVKLRPYVKEFLEAALPTFEIGVYTMGTRDYAEQICMLLARHMVGAQCDQVDLEQLRQRVAHLKFEVHREAQSKASLIETESSAEDTATETDASGATTETETEAETVPVSFPATKSNDADQDKDEDKEEEAAQESSSNGTPNDASENEAEQTGGKRKRVTFGELPPPTRQKIEHKPAAEQLEALQTILDEAERMERLAVDLRQRLFGSRVVSRTDVVDLGRDVKSLRRIFPCGGTMAAVVDDREDVWANAGDVNSARRGEPPENLLLVRPYHWGPFLGFADVNNASGADLDGETRKDTSEDTESDEQLLKIKDILSRVHTQYYSETNNEPNRRTVPEIMRGIRHQVLAGTKMVLSGLVPLHKQKVAPGSAQPRPLYVRYAESMGAILLPAVKEGVTHVVAAKDGTDKTVAARKLRGCAVVKPSWLMDCFWSLRREPETRHLLGPVRPDKTDGALGDSKKENPSPSSSDEDDDNDWAAAFEDEMMESKPS